MKHRITILSAFLITGTLMMSCVENKTGDTSTAVSVDNDSDMNNDIVISNKVVPFENKIFSIPSPIQTAILLRSINVPVDETVLNNIEQHKEYVTSLKRALNLGVYGADLGYLSNSNEQQASLDYFVVVEILAKSLDIKSGFDEGVLTRFTSNVDNPDSLNAINAEFYQMTDAYLKETERPEISAFVLTGAWVESMFLSTKLAPGDMLIKMRIAEQKTAVTNIVGMLAEIDNPDLTPINTILNKIVDVYSKVTYNYKFKEPVVDESTKTTFIRSTNNYSMTDEQSGQLNDLIIELRTLIVS